MGVELKHTEIGDIPADWEVQTFEETFRVLSNNTLSRDALNNRSGSVRNIHYGDILVQYSEVLDCSREDIPYITDTSMLSSSAMPLQDGDVVIADTAEDDAVGKVTEIVGLGVGKLVAGLHTIPCRVKKGDFVPGWLGYYMNSNLFHNQILPYVTGIKVSSVTKTAIAETLVLIPPKTEQELLVKSFFEIDTEIKCLNKLLEKKKRIKQGVLKKLLKTDIVDDNWIEFELFEFAEVLNGDRGESYPSASDIVQYGVPFINAGHLKNSRIDFSKMEYITLEHYRKLGGAKIRKGDILFCLRGSLGKYAYVDFDGAAPASSLCVIRCNANMSAKYLNQMLGSEIVSKMIEDTNSGSSQPNLSADNVKHFKFCFPKDIVEQERIASILEDMDKEILCIEEKKNKYHMVKKGMMTDLFTGKTRLV